jgi:hypothetical protein
MSELLEEQKTLKTKASGVALNLRMNVSLQRSSHENT